MPYVAPYESLNAPSVNLSALKAEQGQPPWRIPLAASSTLRSVLLCWPPGFRAGTHRHPRAVEIFYIIEGDAEFTFNGTDVQRAPAGTHLFAPIGTLHDIKVVGDHPLLFFVVLGPNEADDTEDLE